MGRRLLHCEITENRGEGGMGVVYNSRDSKLGRTVAIKVLTENSADDAVRMERLQREARILASLNLRNIAERGNLYRKMKTLGLRLKES